MHTGDNQLALNNALIPVCTNWWAIVVCCK